MKMELKWEGPSWKKIRWILAEVFTLLLSKFITHYKTVFLFFTKAMCDALCRVTEYIEPMINVRAGATVHTFKLRGYFLNFRVGKQ